MKLYLIRHGEPNYEKDCLTALGKEQAEAVCMMQGREQVSGIICSPLGRARETAYPLSCAIHSEPEVKNWLKEIDDITVWSERRPDLAVWNANPRLLNRWELEDGTKDLPFAKKLPERQEELASGMQSVLISRGIEKEKFGWRVTDSDALDGGDIAIVCHLGVGMLLLAYLLDVSPYMVFRSVFLSPASITSILLENYGDGTAGFRILRLGDTSHLSSCGVEARKSGLQYNQE